MWNKIKGWFGLGSGSSGAEGKKETSVEPPALGIQPERPDLSGQEPQWIEATESPFGVRVLDVRPVTLGMLSMTRDANLAANAVSYGGEDGSSFGDEQPDVLQEIDANLQFRAPAVLVDGALFIPSEMEDKWALFVHGGELILVRSWLRKVMLRARLHIDDGTLHLGRSVGAVTGTEGESPDYTRQALDFILHTYGLGIARPAPLLGGTEEPPRVLASQCMSIFGRKAHYASIDMPARDVPAKPLRVVSRLHFAAMRTELDRARRALAEGISPTLHDRYGFCPMHYVDEPGPMMDLLQAYGASLDDRTDEGATPLMLATQRRSPSLVSALLDRGAAADAIDDRGFSAMHRAAEMGQVDIVTMLLAHGADPDRMAHIGVSPRALAVQRNEEGVLAILPPSRT